MEKDGLNFGSCEKHTQLPYAYVRPSFNVKTGIYGYGGVLDHPGDRVILQGQGSDPEMAVLKEAAGEVLGITAAIEKAVSLKVPSLTIYFQYEGIPKWANGEWPREQAGIKKFYSYIQLMQSFLKIQFAPLSGHSGVYGLEAAAALAEKAAGIR